MRRLWRWLTRNQPAPPDLAAADAALCRATTEAERIHKRWPEVETLSSALRTLRARNHFIEGFRKTL